MANGSLRQVLSFSSLEVSQASNGAAARNRWDTSWVPSTSLATMFGCDPFHMCARRADNGGPTWPSHAWHGAR
eukprot:2298592-Amphidinium_carterae.1